MKLKTFAGLGKLFVGEPSPVAGLSMSTREFQLWRTLIYKRSGISLGDEKRELVKSRLGKRLRRFGITRFRDYYELVTRGDPTGQELVTAIDLITTNKTEFYREREHFDLIEKVILPERVASTRRGEEKRLRLWCAACASGEEAYSLGLTLLGNRELAAEWDAKILATDLSTGALRKGMAGVYEEEKLQPVPPGLLTRYFTLHAPGSRRVTEELRRLVIFRQFNLATGSFPFSDKLDVVLCRNVMIYFDEKTKKALVANLAETLKPGGYLFVGMAESLQRETAGLIGVRPAVYRKPD